MKELHTKSTKSLHKFHEHPFFINCKKLFRYRHTVSNDRKAHCMDIVVGDIVLVRQKMFGTTFKIEDRWEVPVYLVLEKHDDGMTYKVKRIDDDSGKSCKNLDRNMLYPFMSVREDVGEEEERDLVDPPSKSMSYNATVLQEANLGNGVSF